MIILESLYDLSPNDRKKALDLFDKMKSFEKMSIDSYESGNFDKAQEYDAFYEELSDELEYFLSEIDDVEASEDGTDDVRNFDIIELEKEFRSDYEDFINGSVHFTDRQSFVDRLRSVAQEYSYSVGGQLDPSLSDDFFFDLAKELYDEFSSKRKRIKESLEDIEDALDHASDMGDSFEPLSIDDFSILNKEMTINDIGYYDDFSSWMEWGEGELFQLSDEELENELSSFRGESWAKMAMSWISKKEDMSPIVIVDMEDDGTVVGDGRGRLSLLNGLYGGLYKLPVIILTKKKNLF